MTEWVNTKTNVSNFLAQDMISRLRGMILGITCPFRPRRVLPLGTTFASRQLDRDGGSFLYREMPFRTGPDENPHLRAHAHHNPYRPRVAKGVRSVLGRRTSRRKRAERGLVHLPRCRVLERSFGWVGGSAGRRESS